jgi:CRISPR-associated protein Csx10
MAHIGYFVVTLEGDVVLRADAATAGAGDTLDYFPGALFLGVAAETLYKDGDDAGREESFRLFHAGEVRFGDALPAPDGKTPLLPAPRCLHYEKGAPGKLKNFLADEAAREDGTRQYKRVGARYLTGDGEAAAPKTGACLKTALDDRSGTAEDAKLFSYRFLKAGQRFIGYVEADDAASAERALDALKGSRRVGRSKSAQFGKVSIRRLGAVSEASPPGSSSASSEAPHLTVLCLSDLALPHRPEDGVPLRALCPDREKDETLLTLDLERSFVSARRYAPFSFRLQCRMPERLVVEAGSVLTFTGAPALSEAVYAVGDCREGGLGRVWRNPKHLAHTEGFCRYDLKVAYPGLADAKEKAAETPAGAVGNDLLAAWLEGLRQEKKTADEVVKFVDEKSAEIRKHYADARSFLGRPDVGPSVSQWRAVEVEALKYAEKGKGIDPAAVAAFFCKNGNADWEECYGPGKERSFRDALNALTANAEKEFPRSPASARAVAKTADRIAAWLKGESLPKRKAEG